MYLQKLRLTQFRNYAQSSLEFTEGINCFLGDNGAGKTNLLDAIHYLSFTKSAFLSQDQLSIQHEQDFFTLIGDFRKGRKQHEVRVILQEGQKKEVRLDQQVYEKLSEHLGLFPTVLLAPDDTDIIREGSEIRRKFFDSLIAQVDREYLQDLIRYQQALKQRNALLKQFGERHQKPDPDQLLPYDAILLPLNFKIAEKRNAFMDAFTPLFQGYYQTLSEGQEVPQIVYNTQVDDAFERVFERRQKDDFRLQRTTAGIHKDDFLFTIDSYPVKKFGSQGQKKSFAISLRLAQFSIIEQHKEFKPILLLDDIFDKLDDHRIAKLLEMMKSEQFHQVFITDARPERSRELLKALATPVKYFTIKEGTITQHEEETA